VCKQWRDITYYCGLCIERASIYQARA